MQFNYSKDTVKGFSLVELMVVVAIIGILATVAVPNFLKFQAKAKQTNAKSELSGIYTAQTIYYAATNSRIAHLPYIGYIPDNIPLDSSNCPTYNSYNTTWPNRFYRVGYNNEGEDYDYDPNFKEMKCGQEVDGFENASIYTEVPKKNIVSAYSGSINEITAGAGFCELSANTYTGACAIGVIGEESLDIWSIDLNKNLVNISSGL